MWCDVFFLLQVNFTQLSVAASQLSSYRCNVGIDKIYYKLND